MSWDEISLNENAFVYVCEINQEKRLFSILLRRPGFFYLTQNALFYINTRHT